VTLAFFPLWQLPWLSVEFRFRFGYAFQGVGATAVLIGELVFREGDYFVLKSIAIIGPVSDIPFIFSGATHHIGDSVILEQVRVPSACPIPEHLLFHCSVVSLRHHRRHYDRQNHRSLCQYFHALGSLGGQGVDFKIRGQGEERGDDSPDQSLHSRSHVGQFLHCWPYCLGVTTFYECKSIAPDPVLS
jgi:hypothetical protein